jgi:hypothetical protein
MSSTAPGVRACRPWPADLGKDARLRPDDALVLFGLMAQLHRGRYQTPQFQRRRRRPPP